MKAETLKMLVKILQGIETGNVSYGEIAYLQGHKAEVLETGNLTLCQWAEINEEDR